MPELGTTNTTHSTGFPEDAAEYVPDLTWPDSITVYDKMRTDAAVEEAFRGVALPIIKAGWHLDPGDARPEVVEHIARDLGIPVLGQDRPPKRTRTRGRVQFTQHLREALLSLVYGHAVFEQVWEKQADGLMHLVRLASRPAHSILEIHTDERGDLTGIKQSVPGHSGRPPRIVEIPADRLVFYSHAREGSAWQGRSMLRAAYRHWKIKDMLLRIDTQAAERHGVGIPMAKAPENATPEQVAELSKMAQGYRAGANAGGALPAGAELTLEGVRGTLHDTLASIRYQDEQIARVALRTFAMLGQTANGSRALGETLMDDFILSLQAEADDLATTLQEQLVEPLGDWNWGPDEELPTIAFTPIGSDPELTVEGLVALVQAGLVTVDDAVEAYVRNRFDLPELDHVDGDTAALGSPRDVAELVQKIYLGVGTVLSADEARDIANRAGAGLTGPFTPSGRPSQPAVDAGGGTPPFSQARPVRAAGATPTVDEAAALLADLEAELAPDVQAGLAGLIDADLLAADFAASGIADDDHDSRDELLVAVGVFVAVWLFAHPADKTPLAAAVDRAVTVGYGVARGASGTADEIVDAVAGLDTPGLDAALDETSDVVDGIVDTRVRAVTRTVADAVETGTVDDLAAAIDDTLTDADTVDMVTATEEYSGHTVGVLDEQDVAGEPMLYRYQVDPRGPCPQCVVNGEAHSEGEKAGVYRYGDDPPNGYPPVHPRCRCIIGNA